MLPAGLALRQRAARQRGFGPAARRHIATTRKPNSSSAPRSEHGRTKRTRWGRRRRRRRRRTRAIATKKGAGAPATAPTWLTLDASSPSCSPPRSKPPSVYATARAREGAKRRRGENGENGGGEKGGENGGGEKGGENGGEKGAKTAAAAAAQGAGAAETRGWNGGGGKGRRVGRRGCALHRQARRWRLTGWLDDLHGGNSG